MMCLESMQTLNICMKKHLFDPQFAKQYTRTIPDLRIHHYTIKGSSWSEYETNLAVRVAASADFPLFPACLCGS